jgi:hypothetical protein
MAMVSFSIHSFDSHLPLIGRPARSELPGSAEMSACLRGAVGELIEIIAGHLPDPG